MAKTVRIKSELKNNKNKAFWHTVFALFFTFAFACVGAVMLHSILIEKSTLHIAFPCMFLALSLVLYYVYVTKKKEYEVLNSGVKGEQQTYEILKQLPKEYTVITNPVILNRGVTMELDFVVVGKNGVFVVETKNYRGIVNGKTSKSNWKQIKYGKNNKVYEKEIANPVKQSYRQCKRMEELFKDFDITANVYPILYFVDNRTELKIDYDADMNVKIFNTEEPMLDYIQNTKGRETVTSGELAKIIRFFKR